MLDPVEQTYGSSLHLSILYLLVMFKAYPPKKEITVFFIAEVMAQNNNGFAHILKDKRKRELFHIRIRKCLKNLKEDGKLQMEAKKSATQTNYNVYEVMFKKPTYEY